MYFVVFVTFGQLFCNLSKMANLPIVQAPALLNVSSYINSAAAAQTHENDENGQNTTPEVGNILSDQDCVVIPNTSTDEDSMPGMDGMPMQHQIPSCDYCGRETQAVPCTICRMRFCTRCTKAGLTCMCAMQDNRLVLDSLPQAFSLPDYLASP